MTRDDDVRHALLLLPVLAACADVPEDEHDRGCEDGEDDDGDGRIDCADLDCASALACAERVPHDRNRPPVPVVRLDPGPDVLTRTWVRLDGSGSSDPDGDTLAYTWSVELQPSSSASLLRDEHAAVARIFVETGGVYRVGLQVSDGSLVRSASADVVADRPRNPPVADAGEDQQVEVGALVELQGFRSTDPDGDVLTYHWSWVERPPDSTAGLSGIDVPELAVSTSFVPDVAGRYVAALEVDDGTARSAPDEVVVTAVEPETP
jgi:hypothetical protein